MLRECVILVLVCFLEAWSLSGRGFFCRDPDTGKLHEVNTTWASSSFCGNYHCRLRRKNLTETEYAPMRTLNVTNVLLQSLNLTKDKAEIPKNLLNTNKGMKEIDIKNEITTIQELFPIERNVNTQGDNKYKLHNETDRDRYLTDTEIRTISEILHTVKKSDLDAIVEIYNLAQEIYKEIDKTSPEQQAVNKAFYNTKTQNTYNVVRTDKEIKNNRASYWYEPLSSNKIRPADLIKPQIHRNAPPVIPAIVRDMEEQASNAAIMRKQFGQTLPSVQPHPAPPVVPGSPYKQRPGPRVSDTYFNGPLTSKDFGKLPYYYPMSSFQRMSSYKHQTPKPIPMPMYSVGSIASNKMPLPPKPILRSVTYKPQPVKYSDTKYQYPKEIKPSVLLPYPFSYIHHYNSTHHNARNNVNQISQYELTKNGKYLDKTRSQNTHYLKISKAVLMNPDLENFQDLEVKATREEEKLPIRPLVQKVKDEKRRPEWQTDPLPNHIIEEVRARIQDKQRLKPFPLRKKVKLERVGKLLKLEEKNRARAKREVKEEVPEKNERILEPELYEVYIERTTCHSDYSVPGYFRYGNLSQPFPDCCPQRIS